MKKRPGWPIFLKKRKRMRKWPWERVGRWKERKKCSYKNEKTDTQKNGHIITSVALDETIKIRTRKSLTTLPLPDCDKWPSKDYITTGHDMLVLTGRKKNIHEIIKYKRWAGRYGLMDSTLGWLWRQTLWVRIPVMAKCFFSGLFFFFFLLWLYHKVTCSRRDNQRKK